MSSPFPLPPCNRPLDGFPAVLVHGVSLEPRKMSSKVSEPSGRPVRA